MENEPDDSIEIFGYDVDKNDALRASQALVLGGALVRANANNKEKQRKAEIARVEENRRREVQHAANEKARLEREFDDAHDPCPYCQTQISKQAALCPSCRHGFFGIAWGLISFAIAKNPLLIEDVTSEKIMSATESVRVDYQRKLESEATERKLENERQIAAMQKLNVEKAEASRKLKEEQESIGAKKKHKNYGIIVGSLAVYLSIGFVAELFSLVLGVIAGYGFYYWLSEVKGTGGKQSGHWSEKPK